MRTCRWPPTRSAELPDVEIRSYGPADEPSWLRCRVLAFLHSHYYDDVLIEKPRLEEESQRYLHVYARGREEVARAVSAEPGLVGVHAFLHIVDMGREDEMRESYGRVYVCRCYERPV